MPKFEAKREILQKVCKTGGLDPPAGSAVPVETLVNPTNW